MYAWYNGILRERSLDTSDHEGSEHEVCADVVTDDASGCDGRRGARGGRSFVNLLTRDSRGVCSRDWRVAEHFDGVPERLDRVKVDTDCHDCTTVSVICLGAFDESVDKVRESHEMVDGEAVGDERWLSPE